MEETNRQAFREKAGRSDGPHGEAPCAPLSRSSTERSAFARAPASEPIKGEELGPTDETDSGGLAESLPTSYFKV